jgi:hypothetical protein
LGINGLELIAKTWDWSGCDLTIKTSFSCPGINSLSFGSGLGSISFSSSGNSSKMTVKGVFSRIFSRMAFPSFMVSCEN